MIPITRKKDKITKSKEKRFIFDKNNKQRQMKKYSALDNVVKVVEDEGDETRETLVDIVIAMDAGQGIVQDAIRQNA